MPDGKPPETRAEAARARACDPLSVGPRLARADAVTRHLLAIPLAFLATAGVARAQTPSSEPAQPTELNLTAYAELLRSDLRTQKVAIITQVMGFTETEDAAFWPIYRDYDAERTRLGDERVAMIVEYAKNYANMTDAVAAELGAKAVRLEAQRQAAKAACYEKVRKVLPARTALRFLQVEHQLLLLIDLQISSALPIAE